MMFTAVRSVGHIKAQPEDFVVQEEMNGRVVVPQFTTTIRPAVSPFTAFTLTKRNVQAVDAYREVARQDHTPAIRAETSRTRAPTPG